MIDAFISTMIGIIVTAFIAVVAFRLKIRNRGEIMISINTFRANVNALRTAFQTTNIYKVKEPHIIQMVNNLDVECMNLLDELSWYYLFSGKPKRLKEAMAQFKSEFNAFQWVDCNQAGPTNRAMSTHFAELLNRIIYIL